MELSPAVFNKVFQFPNEVGEYRKARIVSMSRNDITIEWLSGGNVTMTMQQAVTDIRE